VHADRDSLAVPTPAVSVATTPAFDTKLLRFDRPLPPKPKIALSPPYSHAPKKPLAVPTPVISDDTTPALETKFEKLTYPEAVA